MNSPNANTFDELLDGLALLDAYNSNDANAMRFLADGLSSVSAVRATLKVVETIGEILNARPETSTTEATEVLRNRLMIERDRLLAA